MCLWAIYIFPGSVHICMGAGRPIVGIDTWMWKCGLRLAIPFLGIFVSNFRYCVLAVRLLSQQQWWNGDGPLRMFENESTVKAGKSRSCSENKYLILTLQARQTTIQYDVLYTTHIYSKRMADFLPVDDSRISPEMLVHSGPRENEWIYEYILYVNVLKVWKKK